MTRWTNSSDYRDPTFWELFRTPILVVSAVGLLLGVIIYGAIQSNTPEKIQERAAAAEEEIRSKLPPGCKLQYMRNDHAPNLFIVYCDGKSSTSVNYYERRMNGKTQVFVHRHSFTVGE